MPRVDGRGTGVGVAHQLLDRRNGNPAQGELEAIVVAQRVNESVVGQVWCELDERGVVSGGRARPC